MYRILFTFLFFNCMCFGRTQSSFDQQVFSCHHTDYICIKRQYLSLRDHVLLGARNLSIDTYEPYVFSYGDNRTCVRVSGMEESQLVAIKFDGSVKSLQLKLELPLKMQQILDTGRCQKPEHNTSNIEPFTGVLHKFTGRALIEVTFPFELKEKDGEQHLDLQDQNIDMMLNIPDDGDFRYTKEKDFHNSEWAFKTARNFEAAEFIAFPYTEKYRRFANSVPLKLLISLYPGEDYQELRISYDDDNYVKEICSYLI